MVLSFENNAAIFLLTAFFPLLKVSTSFCDDFGELAPSPSWSTTINGHLNMISHLYFGTLFVILHWWVFLRNCPKIVIIAAKCFDTFNIYFPVVVAWCGALCFWWAPQFWVVKTLCLITAPPLIVTQKLCWWILHLFAPPKPYFI